MFHVNDIVELRIENGVYNKGTKAVVILPTTLEDSENMIVRIIGKRYLLNEGEVFPISLFTTYSPARTRLAKNN